MQDGVPRLEKVSWFALIVSELFVDGSSNARGSRAEILLKNLKGDLLDHFLRFDFQASNNEFDYEALIVGLGLMKKFGATSVVVSSDS